MGNTRMPATSPRSWELCVPDRAPEPPPSKLQRRTIKQWLTDLCVDGEKLEVLMLRNGTICLRNERTREVFFVD